MLFTRPTTLPQPMLSQVLGHLLLVLCFGTALYAQQAPTTLPATAPVFDAPLIVVDPDAYVGQRFPLLPFIERQEVLERGLWLVALYHHDCSACQAAIPLLEAQARQAAAGEAAPKMAIMLVEVPPFAPADRQLVSRDTQCISTRLTAEREWFVPMLTRFVLRDGVVERAATGDHPLE